LDSRTSADPSTPSMDLHDRFSREKRSWSVSWSMG
jgi:hypothetical protein